MNEDEARAALRTLVTEGWLIGVEVFGTDSCCQHGEHADCPSTGFGLCDVFGPNSVGSDCNRANRLLMRPTDSLMDQSLVDDLNDHDKFDGPGNGWAGPFASMAAAVGAWLDGEILKGSPTVHHKEQP